MDIRISIALHIIGLSFWLVGLMILTNLLKSFCSERAPANLDSVFIAQRMKRLCFGFMVPGMVLSLFSGIYQLLSAGIGFYMKQGWFHTKLTLVLVLLVVSVLALLQCLKAAQGEKVRAAFVGKLHAFAGFALVSIVFLTLLGRV